MYNIRVFLFFRFSIYDTALKNPFRKLLREKWCQFICLLFNFMPFSVLTNPEHFVSGCLIPDLRPVLFRLGAFFFWSVQRPFFTILLQVRIKGRYTFFYRWRCNKNSVESNKTFQFYSWRFYDYVTKIACIRHQNNKHTFYIIHTHFIWKRKYMHTLMDDLYTQRLLIFALFATAAYFLIFYNYNKKCVKL